jgi:diguanylate cyclase (GGDEF)-like protein
MKSLSTLIDTGLRYWYQWTEKASPQGNLSLDDIIRLRRQKSISTIILFSFLVIFLVFIIMLYTRSLVILSLICTYSISLIIAIILNRGGHDLAAGFFPNIMSIIVITVSLLTIPGGIPTEYLPAFELYLLVVISAFTLHPTIYAFVIMFINIMTILLILLFGPVTPELKQRIMTEPIIIIFPILFQIIVAVRAYYWGRNTLELLKIADRTDELNYLLAQNQRLYDEQVRIANIDITTNVLNHRAIMSLLDKTIIEHQSQRETFALIFADLDYFKQINDTWGHLAGDAILHEAAIRFQSVAGTSGYVGRYGGEEFIILLPRTGLDNGVNIAEQARAQLISTPYLWQIEEDTNEIPFTASFGVAVYPIHATQQASLIEVADQAMYYSKQHGKNQVTVANAHHLSHQKEAA